jgi:YidC/Oxa1 family membrane protein insertase
MTFKSVVRPVGGRQVWLAASLLLIFTAVTRASNLPAATTSERVQMFSGLWSWMRTLCFWLLDLLRWLAHMTGSWGLAIILVAVLVRLVTYPFARRALVEQKRFNEMQLRLKPALAAIKRDYKGGEQSERIIDLYREHKVNPAAGVKPLLIVLLQLPVFIALFQILKQAPELRGVSFLWIDDLSQPDRLFALGMRLPWFGEYFNVMPGIMVGTIMMAAITAPGENSGGDPGHKRMWASGLMALVFFVIFYAFPAGLVLYWIIVNLLHVAQQMLVNARASPSVPAKR